jgi:hypothetical protein
MPVAGTSSNYTGRKKDISIFQYPDASKLEAQTVFPKFGKNTRFCSGIQKLVQRYAIVLLTNVESQPNYPDFGSDFLYSLQAGVDPIDRILMRQIFTLADYKAVSLLRTHQIENPNIPEDERIINTELVDLVLYGGYAAFDIQLYAESGDSTTFLIPLPK